MKTTKSKWNFLLLPAILLFKVKTILIFAVIILNLWFELGTWLFWLILADIFIHGYYIYAIKMRNRNYKHAAIQTHILNGRMQSFEELKMKELEKDQDLEGDEE